MQRLKFLKDFEGQPAVVGLKHMNPCGVGIGKTIEEAWDKAYEADPVSIFGGIVAFNEPIHASVAEKLSKSSLKLLSHLHLMKMHLKFCPRRRISV